jgi:hypothetical protein
MRARVLVVLLLVGCEKKAPRFDGPMPIAFGDCAGPQVSFVSGPRPLPFTPEQADGVWVAAAKPEPPPEPEPPPPPPPPPDKTKKPDDPQLARKQAIEQARAAGVLGSTALQEGGTFASLIDSGAASGFDDTNVYGGLLGNEAGEMNGGFGFGRSGFGPGGGGTGWGTIGTGRYGTIGHGSGTGSGYGVGGGRGGMRGRTSSVPTVSIGQPVANGDLDKAIIRRYIKRNIQKITYCYEKALLAKPKLAGTVQTQFTISPNGTVVTATGAGVDPDVASCVAGVIQGIQFPQPKGGGGVQVNYPFTFRPAGDTTTAAQPAPPVTTPPPAPPRPVAPPSATREIYRSPDHDTPDTTGYEPGAKSPLRGAAAELTECLRKAPGHDGVALVELAYDATGGVRDAKLFGIDDEATRDCIVEAAKRVKRTGAGPAAQRCPFVFGSRSTSTLSALDITADAITLDGQRLTTPQAIIAAADPKIPEITQAATARLATATSSTAPLVSHDPIAIRPLPTTPMKVVVRVTSSVLAAGEDFVLAAKRDAEWRLLSSLSLPVVPVPYGTGGRWNPAKGRRHGFTVDDESVSLSIYVTKDAVWVGVSRVADFVELKRDGGKLADQLLRTLQEKKKSAFFADRSDLEIAGDDDVPYGDVVDAIDVAVKAGFTEWRFTDPRGLAARPQL